MCTRDSRLRFQEPKEQQKIQQILILILNQNQPANCERQINLFDFN